MMGRILGMYDAKTPAAFVAWFDETGHEMAGMHGTQSEALNCAVELLRECALRLEENEAQIMRLRAQLGRD